VPSRAKPDPSVVLGATALGRLFGKGDDWGRALLRSWHEEQARGGPVRVFKTPRGSLATTLAVVHRELPPARDMALVRKVEQLERDVDFLTRRLDREAGERSALEVAVRRIAERARALQHLPPIGAKR
jgi:hypothetical protein